MTEDGNPASTKGIKGWVSAAINTSVEAAPVASVGADGLTLLIVVKIFRTFRLVLI